MTFYELAPFWEALDYWRTWRRATMPSFDSKPHTDVVCLVELAAAKSRKVTTTQVCAVTMKGLH